MEFSFSLRITLLISSIALSLILIFYTSYKGKRNKLLFSFLFFQLLLLLWSTLQLIRALASNERLEWLNVRIEYFAVCFIGVSWLTFCLLFTENKLVKNYKKLIFLFIIPVVCYISLLTNSYHHQFFKEFNTNFNNQGFWFWIHTIESYSYCLIGTVILINYFFRQFGNTRKQILFLVFGALVPLVANVALITDLFNPGFDITPLTFTISLSFFAVALFKYKLLNTVPIALRTIVNNMKEAIIVVDQFNQIIDFNNSVLVAFSDSIKIRIGDSINVFANWLREKTDGSTEAINLIQALVDGGQANISGELNVTNSNPKCFQVDIRSIDSGKERVGRIISFNDITEYKNLWNELTRTNLELSAKNQQLEEHASTVEELAITKERNRFARDVHDTLGQTMTLLVTLLQISIDNCQDPVQTYTRLNEALKIANGGLKEVRCSLIGLAYEKYDNIKKTLETLIADFQSTGMEIQFEVDETDVQLKLNYWDVIYRICQEALTNSLRHGKASLVKIQLGIHHHSIKLKIIDNGCGCKELIKGLGLSGMEHRIANLNGNIQYQHGHPGFGIEVHFPIIT